MGLIQYLLRSSATLRGEVRRLRKLRPGFSTVFPLFFPGSPYGLRKSQILPYQ